MTIECYYCHRKVEDVIQVYHESPKPKSYDMSISIAEIELGGLENRNMCFKCLHERGREESLKPENNSFNTGEYKVVP